MKDNKDVIKKYREELISFRAILEKYRKAFEESDGGIDEEEQKKLDIIQGIIDRVEAELIKLIEADEGNSVEDDVQTKLGENPDAQAINDFIMDRVNRIDEIVNSIDDIDLLNELMAGDWMQAKNAFDAYQKSLKPADRNFLYEEIQRTKSEIGKRIDKLNGSVPNNSEFKEKIENGIEKIKSDIDKIKGVDDINEIYEFYIELKSSFEVYKDSEDLSKNWVKEIETKFLLLQKELDERVPEIGNVEKSETWEWTLNEYRGDVATKMDKLDKKILKIANKLRDKFDYDFKEEDKKDYKGKKKKWKEKIEDLLDDKEELEADESKITDAEIVKVTVHFIEKTITLKSSGKRVTYWGISHVNLLKDRVTENNGGFAINLDHKIDFGNFSDVLTIKLELVRQEATQTVVNWGTIASGIADVIPDPGNPLEWLDVVKGVFETLPDATSEETIEAANETFEWEFKIETDPNSGDVELSISPETDDKVLGELSRKKIKSIGKKITYEGDMDKANAKFVKDIKSSLKI